MNDFFCDIFFECFSEEEEIVIAFIESRLNVTPSITMHPDKKEHIVHCYCLENQKDHFLKTLLDLNSFLERDERLLLQLKVVLIKEEEWLTSWQKNFYPIVIEKTLQITPSWEKAHSKYINLFLEPKMGFGTGQHPTTYLCLKALCHMRPRNAHVIDIGAGSGILGVAALLLGASFVDFIEMDPQSIESCYDTIQRNHVEEKSQVHFKDIFDDGEWHYQNYDIAFMNILAEVIIKILALEFLKKVPILILSGIIEEKCDGVLQAIREHGYHLISQEKKEGWVALIIAGHQL